VTQAPASSGFAKPSSRPVRSNGALPVNRVAYANGPLYLVYHHTLVLTFRPFLVLRAKLRQEVSSRGTDTAGNSNSPPPPPPWLDKACEYCLDATRHCIVFLEGACEQNMLCRVRSP
jgi:hypothetical protein